MKYRPILIRQMKTVLLILGAMIVLLLGAVPARV